MLVQLGHGYTVELSSNAGFQCFVRLAHTHPKSVIALPSLVWSVPRAGSEKAKIERARGRMNPLTPDYWCIYFLTICEWAGQVRNTLLCRAAHSLSNSPSPTSAWCCQPACYPCPVLESFKGHLKMKRTRSIVTKRYV